MLALKSPNDKVAARECLKMVGERNVDGGAPKRAEDRRTLGDQFLAHNRANPLHRREADGWSDQEMGVDAAISYRACALGGEILFRAVA